MPQTHSLIELDNVCVQRGITRILDHLNLSIPTSEHVAILGPNGSGKSTLLKLLMRFYYPSVIDGTSGIVRILGEEQWNVWELRARLGFVSAEIDHHFSIGRSGHLTPLQSALTGFFSGELEVPASAITDAMNERAIHLLQYFGIAPDSTKQVGQMSTGERRRVMLARAMVMNPQAIILDEPTAGLDICVRAQLLHELERMSDDGTQIVLVTHHLEEVIPNISRIVLLKNGRVYADGSKEETLNSTSISGLFDTPIDVESDSMGYYYSRLATGK